MDPYRSGPSETIVEAPRDTGIVGDVISQFADPMAFYRELIQNSIDAGSPSIEVALSYDDAAGAMRAVVIDRGDGMSRDIVENNLLVLFRSTKERDDTKIGKFGIGFKSVLAPNPSLVVVTTVRDGCRLVVHLRADLSYQLFDGGAATHTGTTVELELPMEPGAAVAFAADSQVALVRWCRHASVPIQLTARGPGGVALANLRIDRPLGLDDAVVEARASFDDGRLVVVVGLRADGATHGGFFNHGLMLHETAVSYAGRIAFKVQDSRLGHTLSRDDVRRDAAFEHAIEKVRAVAAKDLPRLIGSELFRAADDSDRTRWSALVAAVATADLQLAPHQWTLPLIEPVGERRVVVSNLGVFGWGAYQRSAITAAMAASGKPVVDLFAAGRYAAWLLPHLQRSAGCRIDDVAGRWTLVSPIDPSPTDLVLLDTMADLLDAVYRRPTSVQLAALDGVHGTAMSIASSRDGDLGAVVLVDHPHAERNPFDHRMNLNTGHIYVVCARARAMYDPLGAASLLARAALAMRGKLSPGRSQALMTRTLARMGIRA